jgi:hypothetical protein
LSYWSESYTASTTATVWVKALNGSSSFNMYYGKTGTATTANGDNTFEFFDDFSGTSLNGAKWTTVGSPTMSVSGGSLLFQQTGSSQYIYSTGLTFGDNYSIKIRQKVNAWAGSPNYKASVFVGFGNRTSPVSTSSFGALTYSAGTSANFFASAANGSAQTGTGITTDTAGWRNDELIRNPTSYKWINNLTDVNSITANLPSGALPVEIGSSYYDTGTEWKNYIDWIFVRKYSATEPTPSFGVEQAI